MDSSCPHPHPGEGGTASAGACPVAHDDTPASAVPVGAQPDTSFQAAGVDTSAPAAEKPGPRCPFGFTAGNPLERFNCPLCHCLLYDSVVVSPCKDVFCRDCIRDGKDCPTCGRDIVKVEPAPKVQELVDIYIQAHARNHAIGEKGYQPKAIDAPSEDQLRANLLRTEGMFYFHLAVRAMSAGNARSGAARCESARAAIAALHSIAPTAENAVLLGVMLGKLADARLVLQDHAAAIRAYDESIAVLEPHTADAEARHALTVSLNKKGDLLWHQQLLPDALPLYERACALRCAAVEDETAGYSAAQLSDAALGCAKLADALGSADRLQDATQTARRGVALVQRLRACPDAESRLPVAEQCEQMLLRLIAIAEQRTAGASMAEAASAAAAATDAASGSDLPPPPAPTR